jgi:nucleoside-diphosphate-sugar epimerase
VFIAGASGLIGVRLITLLVGAGHDVAGLTRTPAKAERLAALGAEPVVADALDREALARVVRAFAPDRVMHQLTDLPDDAAELRARYPAHARLLRKGTRNVVDAAGDARVVDGSGVLGRALRPLATRPGTTCACRAQTSSTIATSFIEGPQPIGSYAAARTPRR